MKKAILKYILFLTPFFTTYSFAQNCTEQFTSTNWQQGFAKWIIAENNWQALITIANDNVDNLDSDSLQFYKNGYNTNVGKLNGIIDDMQDRVNTGELLKTSKFTNGYDILLTPALKNIFIFQKKFQSYLSDTGITVKSSPPIDISSTLKLIGIGIQDQETMIQAAQIQKLQCLEWQTW